MSAAVDLLPNCCCDLEFLFRFCFLYNLCFCFYAVIVLGVMLYICCSAFSFIISSSPVWLWKCSPLCVTSRCSCSGLSIILTCYLLALLCECQSVFPLFVLLISPLFHQSLCCLLVWLFFFSVLVFKHPALCISSLI